MIKFIATGFYSGKTKYFPGTVGTIVGLPFALFAAYLEKYLQLLVIVLFTIFSIVICGIATQQMKKKDPRSIVLDEWAGIMATFLWVPITLKTVIIGLIAFRFFDIFKFGLVRYCDRRLAYGLGVVADDVIAGLQACLILHMYVAFEVYLI